MRAVTRSQKCEPGWTPEETAARQDADPDIGPIMRWKRVGNARPRWEDILPESRETKVLLRQWERLYLVTRVLHRQFHELEGQGWRPLLVVPADQEEGEITQTEGDGSGAFTQMRPRDSDSGSDDTTPGRESWRSARGQELVVLSTPRPRGRGKRRPERREGAAKRPRVESSSSDRRDESEESRSGGGRDRPGRCSQRAARPSTPLRRPIPASLSPRRSPRLTKSAVQDLRSLPRTTKSGRRTAHPRSVSGDEPTRLNGHLGKTRDLCNFTRISQL